MLKDFSPGAPLDELLDMARAEFGPMAFETVHLGGVSLDLLQVQDMPGYLEKLVGRSRPGQVVDLPLWAKIWTSCLILGSFLLRLPLPEGSEALEIGAGGGLCGLSLATRGYRVTLTDLEPAALLFCRANVLKNGLEDRVEVRRADFTRDRLGRRFRCIVGCEVLYQDAVYPGLLDFLRAHLSEESGAEVLLGLDSSRTGKGFFTLARDHFRFLRKDVPFIDPESGERTVTCLYRLGVKPA